MKLNSIQSQTILHRITRAQTTISNFPSASRLSSPNSLFGPRLKSPLHAATPHFINNKQTPRNLQNHPNRLKSQLYSRYHHNGIPTILLPPSRRRPFAKMAPPGIPSPHPPLTSLDMSTNDMKVSVISIANSIQAYSTLHYTQRVYNGSLKSSNSKTAPPSLSQTSPVTPLSARTFGTWTFLSSVIRLYAAYHVHNKQVYELAFWTYGIAFAHFMSEWWVFGSARWGAGIAGPSFVSTGSLVWMWVQWGFYVR